MLNQSDVFFILLEYLSYMLKPLIDWLQLKLDDCKQLALTTWSRLGLTNEPRTAQVSREEQIDPRQWWPKLHNEISAYYEELARSLDNRLNVLEYYSAFVGDHVWSRRATEAMSVGARAANAIALRRLQADTLLKWPDVAVRLEPLDDPFVRLVNWSSADLLVISKEDCDAPPFDWAALLASISEPASGPELIRPVDRQTGQKDRLASTKADSLEPSETGVLRRRKSTDECHASESKFNEPRNGQQEGSHQQAIGPDGDDKKRVSVPMMGLERKADKCDEISKQRRSTKAKLIYSSPSEHEALVSITWLDEDDVRQPRGPTFCWIKHLTLNQYHLHEARSRLVFRLCQREGHFETLSSLYGVVSSLLERAGLLEPSGFSLRQANQLTRHTEQVARAGHKFNLINEDEAGESRNGARWWPETLEMLISDCESHNSIRPARNRLLTRYALFLMLAAYLAGREKPGQQERRQLRHEQLHANNANSLGSLLAGFLATFGQLVPTDEAGEIDTSARGAPLERAGPTAADEQLKIITVEGVEVASAGHVVCELSISFSESADSIRPRDHDGKCRQLIVLDPAATEVYSNKIGPNSANSHQLSNLTKDLRVWPQISGLFGQFHLRLTRPELATNRARNILSSLLEMSDQCRLERLSGVTRKLDEDESLAMLEDEDESEQTKRPRCQLRRTSGAFKRFFATGGSGWAKTRVWKNLLYLVVFLLARNLLVRHLEHLQGELKHSSRQDFIELKRILFPESYLAAAEERDAKEDGISILVRDENTEDDKNDVEDALEAEREQDSRQTTEQLDGLDADGSRQDDEDGSGGDELDSDSNADDGQERAQIDQALASVFGGLLSKGLAGAGGLNSESLQNILGAMGDEGNLDMGEMSQLLANFQQLMPALMGAGGDDGLANLAKMFADLQEEEEDEEEEHGPKDEAPHSQRTTTKAGEKEGAMSSDESQDEKPSESKPANIGSPTAGSDSKHDRASSEAPSSQSDTSSGAPTREEL